MTKNARLRGVISGEDKMKTKLYSLVILAVITTSCAPGFRNVNENGTKTSGVEFNIGTDPVSIEAMRRFVATQGTTDMGKEVGKLFVLITKKVSAGDIVDPLLLTLTRDAYHDYLQLISQPDDQGVKRIDIDINRSEASGGSGTGNVTARSKPVPIGSAKRGGDYFLSEDKNFEHPLNWDEADLFARDPARRKRFITTW